MSIKQKRFSILKITTLVVLVSAVSITGYFIFDSNSQVVAGKEGPADSNITGQNESPFSFNPDATNGWYKGPASERDLALFGKNSGHQSADKDSTDTHFTIIGYRDDGVNEADWLINLDKNDDPSYDRVRGDILTATLQTTDEPIEYGLRIYTNLLKEGVADPGAYGLNAAEVHGYIPYNNGYLRIQGYATPASLLPEVIDAIQSYSLDVGKQSF